MSTGMPQNDNGQSFEDAPEQLAYNPPPVDAAEPPNPVMGAFRERGYDTSAFSDDKQFIQTLESGLSQLSEIPSLREQAAQAQQPSYAPMPDYTEPADAGTDGNWDPPHYDPKWENLVTMDPESGNYVPINEHVNPEVAHRANEYRTWLKDQGREFWNNPYDFMKDGLEGWVRDLVDDQVTAAVDQNNTDNQVDGFLSNNRDRFYVLDQTGQPQVDPATGQELLTPQGESLKYHAESARELGIYDPNKIQAYALNMLERDLYASQANQQYYAQQQQQQQIPTEQTFLQQAANPGQDNWSPNRDASVQTAAEGGMAQNPGLSFFDMAMPEMVNMGLVQQTG